MEGGWYITVQVPRIRSEEEWTLELLEKESRARGATKDLSMGMLAALTTGLCLWLVYGIIRGDAVIIAANAVGAALAGTVFGCKIRDTWW